MQEHVLFRLSLVTCTNWTFCGVDKRMFSCTFVHVTNEEYCSAPISWCCSGKYGENLMLLSRYFSADSQVNEVMKVCLSPVEIVLKWEWNRPQRMQKCSARCGSWSTGKNCLKSTKMLTQNTNSNTDAGMQLQKTCILSASINRDWGLHLNFIFCISSLIRMLFQRHENTNTFSPHIHAHFPFSI